MNTAAYILEHFEVDYGCEIWHTKSTLIPIILKGLFSLLFSKEKFNDLIRSIFVGF